MELQAIASKLGIPYAGDGLFAVTSVSALDMGDASSLGYVRDDSYLSLAKKSHCGILILPVVCQSAVDDFLCKNFLFADYPDLAFSKVTELLHPKIIRRGIHPTAVISPDAQIDASAWVGPFAVIEEFALINRNVQVGAYCYIGRNSQIMEDAELHPRVTIMHDVVIGSRCRVLSGAVIGSEGFGLVHHQGAWAQVPHLGKVLVGNDVDIGANTTIDRGTLSDTCINHGVKIDNLVQIAHNVVIGEHTAIAGCAGLAGSSIVGAHCLLAGGVGLAGHLSLADGVHVTGMSMVTKSIPQAGVYSAGTPLDSNRQWRRNAARFKALDSMARRLARLERHLGFEKVLED